MDPGGWPYRIAAFMTVPHHFGRDFTRGVLDTRHLVFYLSAGLVVFVLDGAKRGIAEKVKPLGAGVCGPNWTHTSYMG